MTTEISDKQSDTNHEKIPITLQMLREKEILAMENKKQYEKECHDAFIAQYVDNIYRYMNDFACQNINKRQDFKINAYHSNGDIHSSYDNVSHILSNSIIEEIIQKVKILLPDFKIYPRYLMIKSIKGMIDEYEIELNPDGTRYIPVSKFIEFIETYFEKTQYKNSIVVDWNITDR
jgi:hypothetical protein